MIVHGAGSAVTDAVVLVGLDGEPAHRKHHGERGGDHEGADGGDRADPEPRVRLERLRRYGQPGELERLPVVDAERGGDEHGDEQRAVGAREAVQPSFL